MLAAPCEAVRFRRRRQGSRTCIAWTGVSLSLPTDFPQGMAASTHWWASSLILTLTHTRTHTLVCLPTDTNDLMQTFILKVWRLNFEWSCFAIGMRQVIIKQCSSWWEDISPACSELLEVNLLRRLGHKLFMPTWQKLKCCDLQQYVDNVFFPHSEMKLVYDWYTVDCELRCITFVFASIFWQLLVVPKVAFCVCIIYFACI